ncbi:hypothetical protein LCGC14_0872420 [marine sediment metagenome]|uniref:Uncharacterized protein n=1 Tax=marine sediment metagenome TaxID=412755 RepID=A0A0F9P4A7_9ZZZZ
MRVSSVGVCKYEVEFTMNEQIILDRRDVHGEFSRAYILKSALGLMLRKISVAPVRRLVKDGF